MKRKSYEIRKRILTLVKDKPVSYTSLQTKLSTNYDSIKDNCSELADYGFIEIKEIKHHPKNGNKSIEVNLTELGRSVLKKIEKK